MMMEVAAALCLAGALYLYHVLWLAPERLRAALRNQGIAGPRPSFPYGNLAEMRRTTVAGDHHLHRGGGIVHDYRSAMFPFYDKWRKEYGKAHHML
jgi:gibberellin 13-oxidase